jgi:hypothetical protein
MRYDNKHPITENKNYMSAAHQTEEQQCDIISLPCVLTFSGVNCMAFNKFT